MGEVVNLFSASRESNNRIAHHTKKLNDIQETAPEYLKKMNGDYHRSLADLRAAATQEILRLRSGYEGTINHMQRENDYLRSWIVALASIVIVTVIMFAFWKVRH
jgi:hypothetical protein